MPDGGCRKFIATEVDAYNMFLAIFRPTPAISTFLHTPPETFRQRDAPYRWGGKDVT